MRVVKASFNSYRRPEFQTSTRIIQDGAVKRVEKQPLCKEAEAHLLSLSQKSHAIQDQYPECRILQPQYEGSIAITDFDGGVSLYSELVDLIHNGHNEAVVTFLQDFREFIAKPAKVNNSWWMHKEFVAVFGQVQPSLQIPTLCLEPANIDASFSNVHVGHAGDKGHTMFDCEWTFTFPVPLDFILWRAADRFKSRLKFKEAQWLTFDELINVLGITSIDGFASMESCFQKYVFGEKPFYGLPDEFLTEMPYENFDDIAQLVKRAPIEFEKFANEIKRLSDDLALHKAVIQEHIQINETLNNTLNGMQSSLSWRLTRPLRSINARLRGRK